MTLHFFELKKLPKELNAKNTLLLWLSLFKAETQEELDKIKSLEVSVMEKAINAYNTITVSPEFKELERLRSLARHNEASALRNAREQRDIEIARNALQMNLPVDSIAKLTGLSLEEVKKLCTHPQKKRKKPSS
jgi:predicted transposase/invertase (TIGR01784 family)